MKKIIALTLILAVSLIKLLGQQYAVSTSAVPPEAGTTAGGGIYDMGATVTVTATPNANYRFVSWTEGAVTVSTEAAYSFTLGADRVLAANFALITYTVNTTSDPATGGTTTGNGSYDSGTPVTVTATASAGYRFVNWTESGSEVSASASYNFPITANRVLTANFIRTYTVITSSHPTPGGTTSGNGTYDSGASVTVTAMPSSGFRFVNWTESGSEVSSSASYNFTISASRNLIANFVRIFTVVTSSNPSTGGSTSGGGTYDLGASVTVTALPATGYSFVSWTENSIVVSSSASYIFSISDNRNLTANFILQYSVATSSSPSEGGTTTGSGSYNSGASVAVVASPASGYRFANWTDGSTVVSESASYNFTISANRNLTANFIRIYTVTTSSNPSTGGSAAGSGTYDSGASVTVTATPAAGYRFVNWTEGTNVVSTSASYNFTVSANRNLIANFIARYTVTTASNPPAGGSTAGSGTYDSGTSVTVTATPATGYRFVNWTDGSNVVSASASYNFPLSASRNLTANFIAQYSVATTSNPVSGGSTTGSGTYDSGTSVIVIATPATGYRFVNWTEGTNVVSTSASYNFTIVANRNLTANFIRIYNVVTLSIPSAGGSTSGSGTYDSGASVTVIATPVSGYRFANWTEGTNIVSANTSYNFSITSNRNLSANFIQVFTAATTASPPAGGTVTGSGTFDSGTSVTVTATFASGFRFVNWTESGSPVSTNASFTFTISSNRSLTANFIQIFTIGTSSNPSAGGSTTGSGIYDSGASATITATANVGYRFTHWTEGGANISLDANYTFTVSDNRALTANFIRTYSITASANPAAGGTITGSGTYDAGAQVTMTARPEPGYRFASWTEAGSIVSMNTDYTFTITSNRTLTANYIEIYTITTASNPSPGGTTSGGGSYDTGTTVTVSATPATGYRFVSWTEGSSIVSSSPGLSFTATAGRMLIANFIQVFSVTSSSVPTAGGTTTGGGTFDTGTQVTLTATPATGYRFAEWTEGGSPVSGNAIFTFILSANRNLSANFIRVFTVSTGSVPVAGGSTSGGGTYDTGAIATVTATPATGYRFVSWTEAGVSVSNNASFSFSLIAPRSLTANFIQIFTITSSSLPAAGGTTSGSGTYDSGASVTVSANPANGYRFVRWTENSTLVSSDASYTFTATTNRNLTANFIQIYSVSTSAIPSAGGTATGGGVFDSGVSATVAATPVLGYKFENWTENGSPVSDSDHFTFAVTGNRTLVANFSLIPIIFNLTDNNGQALHNNDTIRIPNSDAGGFLIRVESNFDWTVSESSLWLAAVKENGSTINVTYKENISVIEKICTIRIRNQLNSEINVNISQRARVSSLGPNKFENIIMYPNPVNSSLYFKLAEEDYGKVLITVSSIQGHLLSSVEFDNVPGSEILKITVSTLPAGQYIIRIGDGTNHKVFRMVKLF